MLKLAYTYRDKLNSLYQNIVFDNKYKYYNCVDYWGYEIKLNEDSYLDISMVSVDEEDNVRGFLRASIDRVTNKVSALAVINFHNANVVFAKDLYQFLKELFEKFNFYKIEFSVVVGNPIEKMYDKYIQKYGGQIIGTFRLTTRLQDGELADMKYYEIFRDEYLKYIKTK